MAKILLLSDTHSHMDQRLLHYAQQADQIWHAGDIGALTVTDELAKVAPLIAVYGNIDDAITRMEFPEYQFFEVEGQRILMLHIAGNLPKYNAHTLALIQKYRPHILCCGHSHILKVQYIQNFEMLHINPGACGIHGFHKVRTMLRFNIDHGKISAMELIEIER